MNDLTTCAESTIIGYTNLHSYRWAISKTNKTLYHDNCPKRYTSLK